MKTYGESRPAAASEDFTTNHGGGWKGTQSRKVARRRRKDKKIMHRHARHTAVIE